MSVLYCSQNIVFFSIFFQAVCALFENDVGNFIIIAAFRLPRWWVQTIATYSTDCLTAQVEWLH